MTGGTKAFRHPPEGVLAGESVPRENEESEVDDSEIEEIMNELKQRGEPYLSMSKEERREKALEIWHKGGDK